MKWTAVVTFLGFALAANLAAAQDESEPGHGVAEASPESGDDTTPSESAGEGGEGAETSQNEDIAPADVEGDAVPGSETATESEGSGAQEADLAVTETEAPEETEDQEEMDAEDEAYAELDSGFQPGMTFRVFSDANLSVSDVAGEEFAFAIGGVDFFVTGELSENVRALSESVLEILGEDGVVFDLERIYLEWAPFAELTFRLGRDHLMVGHYMSTYHHALFFQLASSRPIMLGFEDEGGLLPAHLIGLEVLGAFQLDFGSLRYAVSFGNGRGQFADDVLSTFDRNPFKSISARVTLETNLGLTVGVSGLVDQIPGGFTNDLGMVVVPEDVWEYLVNGYVVYEQYPVEALGEVYYIRHVEDVSGNGTDLFGAYLQGGVTIEEFITPYARIEYVDRSATDAFFNASGAPLRVIDLRIGVRLNLADQALVKVEYQRDFQNEINVGTIQAAFAI